MPKFVLSLILSIFFAKLGHTQQLVVLQYHHVAENTPLSTSVSPQTFVEHMEKLAEQGYQVVDFVDALQKLLSGEGLEDKSVAITFDDGFVNLLENAVPVLEQHKFPFSVFANTQPIEQKLKSYMSWEQLKQLSARGGRVLNHGHNHASMLPRVNETDAAWRERIKTTILRAQQLLQQHLNVEDKVLAYPYGEFNQALESLVGELGFIGVGQHSGAINAYSSLTRLPRFPAAGSYANLATLAPKLQSLAFKLKLVHGLESWLPIKQQSELEIEIQEQDFYPVMLNCFYDGVSIKPERLTQGRYRISHKLNRASIRERINCTAPSIKYDGKRHYWWSHPYFYRQQKINNP